MVITKSRLTQHMCLMYLVHFSVVVPYINSVCDVELCLVRMRRHMAGYTPRAGRDARPRFYPAVIGAIVLLLQCVYTAAITCPPNSVLQTGGDCVCNAGFHGDPADTMIRCGGTCQCDGFTAGDINDSVDSGHKYRANDQCWWIISGTQPSVTFEFLEIGNGDDVVYVESCTNAECTEGVVTIQTITSDSNTPLSVEPGDHITVSTDADYMRVWFSSDYVTQKAGFKATWDRGGWPLQCIACNQGQYKAMAGPTDCVDCAAISQSESGSAECQCKAGYTGETVETPTVTCGGNCGCSGSVAWGESIFSGKHVINADCWWLISGLEPTLTLTTLDIPTGSSDSLKLLACTDSECSESPDEIEVLKGKPVMPRTFVTTCATGSDSDGTCVHKQYLRVLLKSHPTWASQTRGFTATWSADVCSSCGLSEYKDTEGAQACTDCPSNTAVAVRGVGTNINRCKCIDGTSAAHELGGIPCIGPRDDCPANSANLGSTPEMEKLTDCECDAGYTGDASVEMIRCGGDCGCNGWVSWDEEISDGPGSYTQSIKNCWWIISGTNPEVTFTSFETQQNNDFVFIQSCTDASCSPLLPDPIGTATLTGQIGQDFTQTTYTSTTPYLRVLFIGQSTVGDYQGFTATWVKGAAASCVPCQTNTYKATAGLEACAQCQSNASSAEGSSECACNTLDGMTVDMPSIQCSGNCGCSGVEEAWGGTIYPGLHMGGHARDANCSWIVSGVEPTVKFEYVHMDFDFSNVKVFACNDIESCAHGSDTRQLENFMTTCNYPFSSCKQTYTTMHPYLRVEFGSATPPTFSPKIGFIATWTSKSCNVDMECDPGHEPSGTDCVPCTLGMFKSAHGTGSCLPCPDNAVSEIGSSECLCGHGFHHQEPV